MLESVYHKLNSIFRLAFLDKELEQKFQKSYLERNILQNRLATILAVVVHIIYLPVVYTVIPEDFTIILKLMLYIIFPSAALFLWISYQEFFKNNIPTCLFFTMLFVGSGAVLSIYFTHGYYQLIYAVVTLPIIGIFLMSGAPFVISLLSVLVLMLGFLNSIYFIDLDFRTSLFSTFLILSSFLFSAISSYMTEKSHRRNYVDIINQKKLNIQLKEEEEKNIANERVIQEQSRLAQMGELINMIAHQWRQPLTSISSVSIDLKMKSELKKFNLEKVNEAREYESFVIESIRDIDKYVTHLTTTIDDFRNFYKKNKKLVTIELEKVVIKSLSIIGASLVNDNIEVIEDYNSSQKIEMYDSEIMQVILNIIKNAQDNFVDKDIQDKSIKITIENRSISIYDNAGGVPESIIESIFDPYFSTKSDKNGTGLGLYMSKTIVEKNHNGTLSVSNTSRGACFTITL